MMIISFVIMFNGDAMIIGEDRYLAGAIAGQGKECYVFRLGGECVLDATMRDNIARFIFTEYYHGSYKLRTTTSLRQRTSFNNAYVRVHT